MKDLPELDFTKGELLLVDKPLEWTSTDVVRKLRNLTGAKTGHGGTLDPLATGLLIIAMGKATKQLNELQNLPKEYTGTIRLGATRASFDRETEAENEVDISHLTDEDIHKAAASFIGINEQVPPAYSAIKIGGKPAYESARKGKPHRMEPRRVEIFDFRIENINLPYIDFYVHCTKGTYIRSLAHDLGQRLGVGAYLHSLRRTSIGEYKIEDAWALDELVEKLKNFRHGNEGV